MSTPLVELKQISKRFGDRKIGPGGRVLQRLGLAQPPAVVRAVDGIDLAIQPGEVVGLVGESGCGKSTLGRIAAGLMPPSDGEVRVDGKSVDTLSAHEARDARLKIQMIFQDPYASLNPRLRVEESIGEAPRVHGLTDRANFADYVAAQMERAGLDPALRDDCMRISKRVTEAYCVLRDPRRRQAYDGQLETDETTEGGALRNRMQLAQALSSHTKRDSEERQGKTPQGRQFYQKAAASLQRGDNAGAISNLQMALTFEPGNTFFKESLQHAKASSS